MWPFISGKQNDRHLHVLADEWPRVGGISKGYSQLCRCYDTPVPFNRGSKLVYDWFSWLSGLCHTFSKSFKVYVSLSILSAHYALCLTLLFMNMSESISPCPKDISMQLSIKLSALQDIKVVFFCVCKISIQLPEKLIKVV